MPSKSSDKSNEVEMLKAALAESEEQKKLLSAQYEDIKHKLKEALDGNKALLALLQDLQGKLDKLLFQTQKRNQKDFGQKDEHHNPSPAPALDSTDSEALDEPAAPISSTPKEKANRNHKKHALADDNLPV